MLKTSPRHIEIVIFVNVIAKFYIMHPWRHHIPIEFKESPPPKKKTKKKKNLTYLLYIHTAGVLQIDPRGFITLVLR